MRRPLAVLTLVALALATTTACTKSDAQAPAPPKAAAAIKPLPITVARAESRQVQRTVETVGSLVAWQETVVKTEQPGTIAKLLVDLGDAVTAGKILAEYDAREFQFSVEQADADLLSARQSYARAQATLSSSEAALRRSRDGLSALDAEVARNQSQVDWAKSELDRTQELFRKEFIAQRDVDSVRNGYNTAMASLQVAINVRSLHPDQVRIAEAQLDADRAALRVAEAEVARRDAMLGIMRKRLGDTTIRAPFAGQIAKRHVNPGEYVKENTPVFSLVALDPLKYTGTVPERFAPEIKVGQRLELTVEAYPGQTFAGQVTRLSPSVEVQTRSLALEGRVANGDNRLRPGFFAKGVGLTRMDATAAFVPAEAVVYFVGISKVFVVGDGKVAERIVRAGSRQGALVEILDGVKAGETVAVTNLSQLFNGAPITLVNGSAPRDQDPARPLMGFLEVFVRRPVFTTMVIATMVVLGLASFVQLGVDIFPKVDLPTITITTLLPGASPEEIESQITKPIEEVVNTISGLDELRSSTIEGQSQVFATFVLERSVQEAANDVREKVGTVLSRLPAGTESPIVEKVDPDSAPVMALVVSGQRSAREITEIADKRIKRALETVKDVGAITLVGDRKREIQILVNPDKLSAFGLSIQQIKDALIRQNVEIPGGRLTAGGNEEGLRTLGRIESVAAFEDLIVADAKGSPVRARDVATIRDAEEEPRTLSRLNGANAVSLLVRKQSGTNTVAVVDRIKARLVEVQRGLPQDIQFEIVRDLSRFIKRSFHEVQDHLLLGGLLASLIVAFFIGRLLWYESLVLVGIIAAVSAAFLQGDPEFLLKVTGVCILVTMVFFFSVKKLRPAFVAALAIPVSIIATFTAMRVAGFTLNNLTMLGLSLSTGIVIDDAIIVLENIFRHTEEERRPPFEAAVTGTREISLAVTATTVSLVVIFLPVAFMGGLVGKFWNSFGLTATFAIMVSLVVAFTLTPMLAARILAGRDAEGEPGPAAHAASKSGFYHRLETAYETALGWCLRHRAVCFVGLGAIMVGGWFLITSSKLEFVVDDDMSEFEVVAEAPPGSSIERSATLSRAMEDEIRKMPEVVTLFTTVGVRGQYQSNVTDISIYVGLKHLSQRKRVQLELMNDVRQRLLQFPGMRVSVQNISLISGGGFRQTQFNLILRGPELAQLERHAQNVLGVLRTKPGFVDLDTAQSLRQPEVQVQIDRHRASDLGVRVDAVATALRTMVGGEKVGFYREGGEQYDIRLRLEEEYRKDASGLPALMVPAGNGSLVKLSNVTSVGAGMSPGQIERYAQERSITIISNLLPEKPLAEAFKEAFAAVAAQRLPPEYGILASGRGKLLQETLSNFLIAFLLSLCFIYIVLAAQFESFVHPLTIMVSMFLSIPFGVLTLKLLDKTLNIYSIMGLFLLMGVVKKNAILQVDYTNVLRERGMPRDQAQMEADRARLRPILMTTLAIVAGMLPVALGRGDGSASRASLATVVVGGQLLCLVVTLLITPVIYSTFDDMRGLRAFAGIRFPRWKRALAGRLAWGGSRFGARRPEPETESR